MIRDHGQTSQALQRAAAQSGVKPPAMIMGEDQAHLLSALQSMKGPEFDRTYWRHQVLGHRSALTVAQNYAANGDSAPLRQVASSSVPVISAHMSAAERKQAAGDAP